MTLTPSHVDTDELIETLERLERESLTMTHGFDTGSSFLRHLPALTTLVRTYDKPTLARDVAACNGYDLRDFALNAAGQFELDALKKAFAAPATKRRKK